VADRLNQWGFSVRGYDQYGHGESAGVRGDLPADDRLLTDLASIIDDTRARMDDRLPLILLGHSMGGLVAARLVSLKLRRVDALVLSSPALDAGLSVMQKALAASLWRLAPRARVANGIDPRVLSRDPAAVQAYQADPLVHDRISARLAHFIATAGPAVLQRAPRWKLPTLLLYAGQDRAVAPAGSAAFARAAPAEWVTAHAFPLHYHELFNEPGHAGRRPGRHWPAVRPARRPRHLAAAPGPSRPPSLNRASPCRGPFRLCADSGRAS
jgi:alpha-beta hydrolase superfamily lysophospholipase